MTTIVFQISRGTIHYSVTGIGQLSSQWHGGGGGLRVIPGTFYQNKLQMDERFKREKQNHKNRNSE